MRKKNLKGTLKIRANSGEEKTAASSYEMEMQGVRGEWIRSPTEPSNYAVGGGSKAARLAVAPG